MRIPARILSGLLPSAMLAVICVVVTPTASRAQAAHYSTQQYGPRASLLSGAVIGSNTDISGTYYNPGALALAKELPFAISTDVFESETITLEDGAGSGVDLGTNRSGVRPSLLAGSITQNLLGDDVLAYSVLTRSRSDFDVSAELIASGADVPPDLGLDDVVGIARIDGSFRDLWAGLSYAHGFSSKFGLGLTLYGAARSQRRRTTGIEEAIDTTGATLARIEVAGGNYNTLRGLAKLGAYLSSGPFSAGLTFTTPSLHITGSGEFGTNAAEFSRDTTALAATVQTDLKAKFKSPLSVGFGLGYQIGKARLNASGEWFDKISPYVVLQGEPFLTQAPQEIRTPDVVQAADDVFNWSAGLEYMFNKHTAAYASFATNKSAVTDQIERADLALFNTNLQSVSAGADFVVKTARLTLGVGYAWGSSPAPRLTDVLGGEEAGFNAKYKYRSIGTLFGFELGVD